MNEKYIEKFSISVDGEQTEEKWLGSFKVKTKLSHRDSLNRDRVYRDHIGKEAGDPSPLARDLATIFSELSVRLTETPAWWTESGNGVDLIDNNVVLEVYKQAMEAGKTDKAAVADKATKAATELKEE